MRETQEIDVMTKRALSSGRDPTAWLRMQSAANLSLPAIWEMQGDFRKMQGDARRTLAKSHQISIACMAFSLLQGAGRSREAYLALAGFVSSIRGRSSDFGCYRAAAPEIAYPR